MRKSTAVLLLLAAVFVLAGVQEAHASVCYTLRQMRIFRQDTGAEIQPGGTVYIAPHQTLLLNVYAGDSNDDGILDISDLHQWTVSDDARIYVSLADTGSVAGLSSSFIAQGSSMGLTSTLSERIGTIAVTATDVINTTMTFQLEYGQGDVTSPTTFAYSSVFPIRFVTTATVDLYYLYIPKSMSIRDGNHNKITSQISITGGSTTTLYVDTDDFNGDHQIDDLDYFIFPVSATGYTMTPTVVVDDPSIARASASHSNLLGLTPTQTRYPTTIATLTLSAINTGGTEGDLYNPAYTFFSYTIALAGTTADGTTIEDVVSYQNEEEEGTISTQSVTLRVNPLDDANAEHEDDRGGTCSAFGLGALLLAAPLFFARKKSV